MTYRVWTGDEVPVPTMDGEALVVPNVAGLVFADLDRTVLLLQRRDKPGEPVRGLLELPGGRWRAGEPPDVAIAREVLEETGVRLTAVAAAGEITTIGEDRACAIVRPLAVVNGIEGTYPSVHVLFECYGEGDPRPVPGETADPAWWPVDEVHRMLATSPESFVDQTRAMLIAYFGA